MACLVSMEHITKTFSGNTALNDVSLELNGGETHAIMGENGAGKSTLLNILTGSLQPDSGKIIINGKEEDFKSPLDASNKGITIVHQELSTFPHLTVGENILVDHLPQRFGLIDRRKIIESIKYYLNFFGVSFTANTLVKTLSIPEQQVVEIIKSLIVESAHTYVFDEPTSSLGDEDVGKLFKLIEGLRQQGKAVVYVSHKFDEIFRISNRIIILRDGNMVGTGTAESYNAESIIRLMVGRSLDHIYPPHGQPSEKVLFDVNNLSAGPKCKHVSFKLYQGEILGLFGLVGAGRTEIARAIVGANKKQSGDLSLNGKKINIKKIQDSISNGVFYLTENRKIEGLFLKMSILDNVVVTDLDSVSSSGLLRHNLAKKKTLSAMEHLHVKAHSSAQLVQSLSGGNQQKVMVTKWLERQPKVLILDEPTRGIDVGAKAEIHQLLRDLSNKGVGVIVISSELPEIVGLSDRVLVVYDGSIMAELRKEQITEDMIMHYASGLEVNERLG